MWIQSELGEAGMSQYATNLNRHSSVLSQHGQCSLKYDTNSIVFTWGQGRGRILYDLYSTYACEIPYTVRCYYNPAQYNMILHATSWKLRQIINKSLYSQKTQSLLYSWVTQYLLWELGENWLHYHGTTLYSIWCYNWPCHNETPTAFVWQCVVLFCYHK